MLKLLKLTSVAVASIALFVCVTFHTANAVLPDLVPLAKTAGHAVVNISTEKEITGSGFFNFPSDLFQGFQGLPPGFEHFFNQFGNQFGGQGQQPRMQKSLGTGFIISSDGYIVTNDHVVANADVVKVYLEGTKEDKDKGLTATVIGTDPDTDLALLKVDAKKTLPYLEFGDSDAAEVGEWVLAIGNPFGLGHTVTQGILSAKGRDIRARSDSSLAPDFLQTDASINPGNSGGPLINMEGKVIGINAAIIASGQGIGFAIPSNEAKRIVDQLKTDKRISRGWIGVTIQHVDKAMADALGLKKPEGALIASVVKGEPAEAAGLQEGDIIIEVNGKSMANSDAVLHAIAAQKPGSTIQLTVWRDGEKKQFSVKLGDRASATGHGTVTSSAIKPMLGLSVRPITREESSRAELPSGIGLLITKIAKDSPASEANLRRGDVIISANRKQLRTTGDLANVIEESKKRGAILLRVWRNGQTFFCPVPLMSSKQK